MTNVKKTVLIVEDSPTQSLSLQLLLENEGLNVLHTPDGLRGIQIAQDRHPDAIVLDVDLPGMNGFEAAVVLSRHHLTEGIPIIILTKLDDSNSMRKSLILGAIEFIPKDIFAETVLLETLKQLKILEKTSIDV
jgi:CheY-like chemotaxis protein